MRQNGDVLRYASEELRADHKFVLAALQQDSPLLRAVLDLSSRQSDHHEILLAAAQQNGHALGLASEVLRADHEVVMAAVRQNGVTLRYVSEELRADHEVALAAMLGDGHALGESSESSAPSTRSFWRPFVGLTIHGGMPQRSSVPITGWL